MMQSHRAEIFRDGFETTRQQIFVLELTSTMSMRVMEMQMILMMDKIMSDSLVLTI
jgi:hypothetical protein